MSKSTLRDGIIIPPTHLEMIVSDHCNLTCGACNHASPIMPSWFANPEDVFRDFSILAKHYRPAFIKVLGGEPLMHKHLPAVIEAGRASGIGGHFTLTTNGVLLHKASDAVWLAIDEMEVSVYPGVAGIEDNLLLAERKARDFNKKLIIYRYDEFRMTFSQRGTDDDALVGKVYAACKIANLWGCHAVREGYFHKCPQSIYVPMMTGKAAGRDRLRIADSNEFQAELLAFVNSPAPLASCRHCVGTVGLQAAHSLPPRKEWHAHIDKTLEEIIDFEWLERCLHTRERIDDCKIPMRFESARLLKRHPRLAKVLRAVLPKALGETTLRQGKQLMREELIKAERELAGKGSSD